MNEIKSNLYDCKHCPGTGTCSNGPESSSCAACIKKNELKGKNHQGILCRSCGGIGMAEPMTERMNKWMVPILAIFLTVILLSIISTAAIFQSPYFSELLAFSSAIIGAVCGFYFSNGNRKWTPARCLLHQQRRRASPQSSQEGSRSISWLQAKRGKQLGRLLSDHLCEDDEAGCVLVEGFLLYNELLN